MIQRKQTLFLLELAFLGLALLFIPSATLITANGPVNLTLTAAGNGLNTTVWHSLAMILNFAGLLVSFITIFLYRKRELQIKLCYVVALLWVLLGILLAFCPLALSGADVLSVQGSFIGPIISLFAVLAAFLAARFIRKDIELLKSADRIR